MSPMRKLFRRLRPKRLTSYSNSQGQRSSNQGWDAVLLKARSTTHWRTDKKAAAFTQCGVLSVMALALIDLNGSHAFALSPYD